jgi:hypothetical protein
MANLGKKNGVFLARFRFQGKEYKRSLRTTDRKAADGAMHRVEDALHRLAIGLIAVPKGVDPGDLVRDVTVRLALCDQLAALRRGQESIPA